MSYTLGVAIVSLSADYTIARSRPIALGNILLIALGVFTGIQLGTLFTTYLNDNTLEGLPVESFPTIVGIITAICAVVGWGLGAYLARQQRARLLLPIALFIALVSATIYLSVTLHYDQSSSFWSIAALVLGFGVTCVVCGVGLIVEGFKEKKLLFVVFALLFTLLGSAALILDFLSVQSDSNNEAAFKHWITGDVDLQGKNYDAAIGEFSTAIELSPYDTLFYQQRAEAYTTKGDIDKAIADYTQITRIRPNDQYLSNDRAEAYAGLGKLYTGQGKYDQAIISYRDEMKQIAALEQVLGFNADLLLTDYYTGLADALSGKGNYDAAIASYSDTIALIGFASAGVYEEAYYGRGLAYKAEGQRDKAISDFRMAISNSVVGQKAKQQLQDLGVAPD